MTSALPVDFNELDEGDGWAGGRAAPPERLNRTRTNGRTRKRAHSNRSNDVAKRGMHKRRNKRMSW